MRNHQHRIRRLPRLMLLLAGLLYLLGTAAEPLLHVYAAQGQGEAGVVIGDAEPESDSSGSSVPHSESQCLFCKVAGPVVVPSGGPVVALQLAEVCSIFVLSSCSRAPPTFVSPQPRAPPSA